MSKTGLHKLPVGVQNFESLIRDGYLYVCCLITRLLKNVELMNGLCEEHTNSLEPLKPLKLHKTFKTYKTLKRASGA